MHILGLGTLSQHEEVHDWWVSKPVAVPCLGGQLLDVTLENPLLDERLDPEFVDAVDAFLQLTDADLQATAPRVYRDYERSIGTFVNPEDEIRIATPRDVWGHVRFNGVRVIRSHWGDKAVYVQLGANCDWEDEHGLQLIFRRGRELTRVSGIDGHVTGSDDE
jgi:hypothetical protein